MMRQLYHITSGYGCVITSCRDITETSDPEHLSYQELNRKRGRPIGQITIRIEYKGKVGEWFDLLMVTPQEMEGMCKNAGWMMEEVYESENGGYVAILRKKPLDSIPRLEPYPPEMQNSPALFLASFSVFIITLLSIVHHLYD